MKFINTISMILRAPLPGCMAEVPVAFDVTILLFASAREACGSSSLEVSLPGPTSIAEVREALKSIEELGGILKGQSALFALNEEYVLDETSAVVRKGTALALIPPVSGAESP